MLTEIETYHGEEAKMVQIAIGSDGESSGYSMIHGIGP